MSVAVWYSTTRALPRETASRLVADAERTAPLTWYEPIRLAAREGDSAVVEGWSKCPPMSVEVEAGAMITVPPSDWAFMDYWDSLRLFGQLAEWSSRYGVDWLIRAEGEKLGTIESGKMSRRLRRSLRAAARLGGVSGDPDADAARALQLRTRYPELEVGPPAGARPRAPDAEG